MDAWNDLTWSERRKRRREIVKKHLEHLNVCTIKDDCMCIALKVAMLAIAYPRDCPATDKILQKLALQLATSKDERDLEFILNLFADLPAASVAESQLLVLKGTG
ncbi:MAG: hypothetical protein HYT30_01775 [Parcubacteria group bacterium]|nr:hypothetical protein [Parcubacteria group bacterium]